ncbi:MAG TPA: phasin family protein [Sphingomicrobium sp.]
MADEAQTVIEATAGAATQAIEAAGEAAKETTAAAVKTSKRATAKVAKTTRRQAKATRSAVKTARRAKPRRKTKATVARKPAAQERIETVTKNNNNWFAGFNALPNTGSFQTLFADAGERGQEVARRSQKAIEELAEVSRANVEALVDAGKIAVEGARSIGQDVVETSREGVEQAADAVRALAEAKSASEFIQLQTEFARAQFDRFVAESSRLTETFVKVAGEAIQPIQSRATLNAERINKLVA